MTRWLLVGLLACVEAGIPKPVQTCDGMDRDEDGYTLCGPSPYADCDDADRASFPTAIELCDGVDNDCDGVVPVWERDLDGDGALACDADCDDLDDGLSPADADADGWSSCDGDCDDHDDRVHRGSLEACNGLDDDCDGRVADDELDLDADGQAGCAGDCNDADDRVENLDRDADGHPTCGGLDCDDLDPAVYRSAPELCNGYDDDCDGTIDEDCT